MDNLTNILTVLMALSIASERLVEIAKRVVPWLGVQKADAVIERWRSLALQLIAAVAGVVSALLARGEIAAMIPSAWQSVPATVLLGLLASGGSGFWNSISGYLVGLKQAQQLDVDTRKGQQLRSAVPLKGISL